MRGRYAGWHCTTVSHHCNFHSVENLLAHGGWGELQTGEVGLSILEGGEEATQAGLSFGEQFRR